MTNALAYCALASAPIKTDYFKMILELALWFSMTNALAYCATALVSINMDCYNKMTLEFAATVVNDERSSLLCLSVTTKVKVLYHWSQSLSKRWRGSCWRTRWEGQSLGGRAWPTRRRSSTWAQCYKTFLSVMYEFSQEASVCWTSIWYWLLIDYRYICLWNILYLISKSFSICAQFFRHPVWH